MARLERSLKQRMYLLNAAKLEECRWSFTIEGSRGIPYTVTLHPIKSWCTCPDNAGRARTGACKHILFISTRVLRLAQAHNTCTPEMDAMLTNLLLKPAV